MRIRDFIVRWLMRLAMLAMVVGVAKSFEVSLGFKPSEVGGDGETQASAAAKGEQELCRNLVISQTAGGDVLSAERVYTRRMRKGPFCLAAREMVINRLSLSLPEAYFGPKGGASTSAVARAAAPSPMKAIVESVKSGGGNFKEIMPRVVGCTIKGIRISRLEGGTNSVPWVSATRGDADPNGVVLKNGWSVEGGVTNMWDEAYLTLQPYVRLGW